MNKSFKLEKKNSIDFFAVPYCCPIITCSYPLPYPVVSPPLLTVILKSAFSSNTITKSEPPKRKYPKGSPFLTFNPLLIFDSKLTEETCPIPIGSKPTSPIVVFNTTAPLVSNACHDKELLFNT